MKRIYALTLVVLCIFSLFAPLHSAHAASETTVQITEAQLNAAAHLYIPIQNVSSITFDVQDGRLGLIGIITDPPARVVFGILGSVNNGHLAWNIMGVSVNDTYATPEQLATFNAEAGMDTALTQLVEAFLPSQGANLIFTGLTLANHTITVQFTTNGSAPASAPVAAAQGNPLASCTVTTTAGLNLRASASQHGTIITVVPAGTQLTALARQGVWFFVSFQNNEGWLNSGFLNWTGTCS